jgi:hypothetical protein
MLERKILGDAAFDSASGKLPSDRMRAFAWFATVLADYDMPVIVTLDFRA